MSSPSLFSTQHHQAQQTLNRFSGLWLPAAAQSLVNGHYAAVDLDFSLGQGAVGVRLGNAQTGSHAAQIEGRPTDGRRHTAGARGGGVELRATPSGKAEEVYDVAPWEQIRGGHTLSLKVDPRAIAQIPGDKIFFVQLADAPLLAMDVLERSRHFRCFPGQGVSNRHTFSTIYQIDLGAPAIRARHKDMICEAVIRYIRA